MGMRILFCTESKQGSLAETQASRAAHDLNLEGITSEVVSSEAVKETLRERKDMPGERVLFNPDTLYVCDDAMLRAEIEAAGGCAIGWEHEAEPGEGAEAENLVRQTGFPGAKYVFSEIDEIDTDNFVKAWQRLRGLPWDILETERLYIRESTVEDVDSFYRIYADPSMTKYMEGLFENPEDEKRYMKDYIDRIYGFVGYGVWSVILRETGEVIGRAGFSMRGGFDEPEIGFLIGKDWQGRGLAQEAVLAVMWYGREMLGLTSAQALVKQENAASIHILKKVGFEDVETVRIEEDIYGAEYAPEKRVQLKPAHYGNYVRMVWKEEKRNDID